MSKKVNDALKKYYSTLGYDTGVKAFKRGGNIGFAPSKFPGGGDLLHDPESLYGLYLRGQYGYGKLENPTVITPESTQTLAGGTTLRTPKKSEFDWSSMLEGDQGQSSLPLGKNVNMSTPWSAIAGTAGSLTVDLQRLIDAQIRKNDSHVYNPLVSAGLAKGGRKFEGGGFSSSPMDIAGSAVKIAANAVNQASLTTDYDVFQDAVNRYTANQISSINGITDNDSLMNAYANMYQLSDNIKGRDFRDKTVLGDITDGLASSFEGFNATGNWIGAVVGGVSSNIGSIIGRIRANKAANRAEELVRKRNQEIDTRLFHASQDVDRRNDIMRMIGYYNDPFEYAYGGEMRTHGSDWNNGLTFINEGGRHEDNPYEGVPSGVDADGIPNLVEEGEVIWNDEYVFSDRLKVPEALSKKYKLGGEKTFAEAIKKVTKESLTRPNDPISNETNRAIVNEFMDAQEALREKEQAKAARQVQRAYDEDFMEQMDALGQQGQMVPPQGGINYQAPAMAQEGMPIGFAMGGNKFEDGSWKNYVTEGKDKSGTPIFTTSDGRVFYSEAGARKYVDLNKEYLVSRLPDFVASTAPARVVADAPRQSLPAGIKAVYSKGRNGQRGAVHHYETSDGLNMGTDLDKAIRHQNAIDGVNAPVQDQTRLNQENAQVAAAVKTVPSPSFQDINIFGTPDGGFDLFSYAPQDYVSAPVAQAAAQPQGTSVPAEEQAAAQAAAASASSGSQASGKPSGRASGSTGSSTGRMTTPSGETINYRRDINGRDWESAEAYQNFLSYMRGKGKDSPEVKEWMNYIQSEIKNSGSKYKLKNFDDWSRLAEDGKVGPVHQATLLAAQNYAKRQNAPQLEGPVQAPQSGNTVTPSSSKDFIDSLNAAIEATRGTQQGTAEAPRTQPATPNFEYEPTWQRMAPVYGAGAMALYGMLGRPNYENADAIIEAARAAGVPVNIPVQTIGDYRVRKPYDERYLVNMANQNRAAGQRSIYNTSGGNRAMDMLGAMNLAYNNQLDLGEIMRQAYLANRQDDAQVAEFNRGTNIQNMNAINQRNLAQAQLNSQRQATALSGISRGYGIRQGIKDSWDAATMQSINSLLTSLGAIGKENEENNILKSMAEQGYFPYYYGARSVLQNVPRTVSKNGGNKLNKKKRRF